MLELTGREIAELNDDHLRSLVALLCEEELRRQGLPTSAVTAGGDQNAADGGIDVRVALAPDMRPTGFIPRPNTGFQVKKPNMGASAIRDEMRPGGELRASISELADQDGAYIIISAQGSVSDTSLRNRRNAVRAGLDGHPHSDRAHTDFYDRERLATWVRQYPGLVAWVRNRIGRPIIGWQAYGSWSRGGRADQEAYISDSKSRILDGSSPKDGPLTLTEGLARIRATLSASRSSSRLVGLSGLGKTRLAEALFDSTISDDALSRSLALYADVADEPEPSVRDMARHLVETGQRAILIIDNCPPETHRALTAVVGASQSNVSLLTIEYDIRDDEPEGTEVYKLEPASDEVLEELIERRAPHISQNDRRRIADFSGGNFRIALALAQTLRHGESLASFTDSDLFERLFRQRNAEDRSLMHAAEIAALVYSFDGEDFTETGELGLLASLSGSTISMLYGAVADLKARGLVQTRSRWRAVLPHALANRLASQALSRLPPPSVAEAFERSDSRLLRSFSRRLGYLHNDAAAQRIVTRWLDPGGILDNVANLNELGLALLTNIAPVLPGHLLYQIARVITADSAGAVIGVSNPSRGRLASILRSFAYEPEFFDKASRLLAEFVVIEPQGHNRDSVRQHFTELFQIYLSGTHASGEQRRAVIRELLQSTHLPRQRVGLKALASMLKAHHFMSMADFSFGARPRDFGWHPATRSEIAEWYASGLDLAAQFAIESTSEVRAETRNLIASSFREIWTSTGQWQKLAEIARAIGANDPWIDGWIAARTTLNFGSEMPDDVKAELQSLINDLRPRDLITMARAYIFSEPWRALDIADGDFEEESPSASYLRAFTRTEELGAELVSDPDALRQILSETATGKQGRTNAFGRGIATAAPDRLQMWNAIRTALSSCAPEQRNYGVAAGFVSKLSQLDPEFIHQLLDDAVGDEIFGPVFPMLQVSTTMGARDLRRLKLSLDVGIAPPHSYSYLSLGRVTDPLDPAGLAEFLQELASKEGGYGVAVDILHIRLHSARDEQKETGQEFPLPLVACAKVLLTQCDFNGSDRMDYELAELVRWNLGGKEGEQTARQVCKNIFVTRCGTIELRPTCSTISQ